MLIRYKLTTQEATSHKGYKIPLDKTWYYPEDLISAPIPCSNTVLHHYSNPYLASIFNTIHANIHNPRLFKIEITEELGTDGLKGWCREQRIIEELPIRVITNREMVAFAIYCAELVNYTDSSFMLWATNWMNGTDRSYAAATAVARYDAAANYAAATAARYAATNYATAADHDTAAAAAATAATAATARYAAAAARYAATANYDDAAAADYDDANYAAATTARYAATATATTANFEEIINRVIHQSKCNS